MNAGLMGDVIAILERIQGFGFNLSKISTQINREQLKDTDLDEAFKYGQLIVDLYRKIPVSTIRIIAPDADVLIKLNSRFKEDYDDLRRLFGVGDSFLFDPTDKESTKIRANHIKRNTFHIHAIAMRAIRELSGYFISGVIFALEGPETRERVQNIEEAERRATVAVEETEKYLKQAREILAETAVAQQAKFFEKEAKSHNASSWVSLGMTSLLALVFIYLAYSLFEESESSSENTSLDYAGIIQATAPKALVFLVLGYMLTLAVRSYLSNRHNVVVNRHRANALRTFEALVDAAGSIENKEIILTHASSSIFSPQESGYTRASASASQGSGPSLLNLIPRAMRSARD